MLTTLLRLYQLKSLLGGFLHSFLEGWFSSFPPPTEVPSAHELIITDYCVVDFMHVATHQGIGLLWKDCARTECTYMTRTSSVLSVEIMTIVSLDFSINVSGISELIIQAQKFWGPLSMLVACMIVLSHPLRHLLHTIVSLVHFYGALVYSATSAVDFTLDSIEQYVYGYYDFANAFWNIIPLGGPSRRIAGCSTEPNWLIVLIYQSVTASGRAFQLMEKEYKTLEADWTTKKKQD